MLGPATSSLRFMRLLFWLVVMAMLMAALQSVQTSYAASIPEVSRQQLHLLVLPDGRIRSPQSLAGLQELELPSPPPGWYAFNSLVTLLEGMSTQAPTDPAPRP